MGYRAGSKEGRPAGKDDWRTPQALFDRLDDEFHFALDSACTEDNCKAPRGLYVDKGDDGLLMSWVDAGEGGAVWCNPPYSRVEPWLLRGKLYGQLVPVVMLVTADTSTRWWLRNVAHCASQVRFVTGRIKFRRPDGSEHNTKGGGGGLTTPSAIVVYHPKGGPPSYSYVPAVVKRRHP